MFDLHTLGSLDVRSEDDSVIQSVLAQPKRAALLCYLAAARSGGHHTRDSLVAMFWPELDPEHARNALSQALHFLRRSLGTDAILNRNSDDLAINRDQIRCDAIEFERLLERDALEKALALYEGDFLQGFYLSDAPTFERWIDEERERLRQLAGKAATKLSLRLRAQGEWGAAIEQARRSVSLAPYDEQRARVLIELMAEADQAPAAIAFYESFARRLSDDLELKPSAETRALIERLRTVSHQPVVRAAATGESVGARAGRTVATHTAPVHNAATATSGAPGDKELRHSRGVASSDRELRINASESTDPLEKLRNELAPELEVLRLLGRGSTALAYLAREAALKRLVTVKMLRKQLAVDTIARQRFEREAQAAARISHTNVATVYRVGRLCDGCPFIVMEYVDGRSLADTITARGPLPQSEARQVLVALASALSAAHAQGVIHRDVRPGNIFIENRGGRIVLTDFGIAALFESGSEGANQLTPAGTRLGEVRYASPEQARGEPVTELSDVYAFGVVAFELLTGLHPDDAGSHGTSAGNVQSGSRGTAAAATGGQSAPHLLMAQRPEMSPGLVSVVERCLSKEANQRPRAQDVVTMLAGIP